MSTQDIVQKLWNLCNVLRDDGITYHQYVTELTYILFLKMKKKLILLPMVQNFIDKFDLCEIENQEEFKNDILMQDRCDDNKLH